MFIVTLLIQYAFIVINTQIQKNTGYLLPKFVTVTKSPAVD